MMELADMRDLGSRVARRAGSTPVTRTKQNATTYVAAFCLGSGPAERVSAPFDPLIAEVDFAYDNSPLFSDRNGAAADVASKKSFVPGQNYRRFPSASEAFRVRFFLLP